jgi:hypothetical protein
MRRRRRVRVREKRVRVTVQARRVRGCQLRHRLREILFLRWRPPRTTGELFGSGSIVGFDVRYSKYKTVRCTQFYA